MSKINRKKISKCLDDSRMQFENYPPANYSGFHGYHSLPETFTRSVSLLGACVGVEIEMAFEVNEWGRQVFTDELDSNLLWASMDSSLSGSHPLEICTVPLMEHDAIHPGFWKPICARLIALGARSYKNPTTGLHIHVDRRKFYRERQDPNSDRYEINCARTLYGLYVQDSDWKKALFQRQGNSSYAKNNVAGNIMKTIQKVLPEAIRSKECVQRVIDEARASSGDRYSEFNTVNRGTVEFRCGKGTLNPERIAATAEFALLFAKYCECYGKRITFTSQKHFDDFIWRHARSQSMLKRIFKPENHEEE